MLTAYVSNAGRSAANACIAAVMDEMLCARVPRSLQKGASTLSLQL